MREVGELPHHKTPNAISVFLNKKKIRKRGSSREMMIPWMDLKKIEAEKIQNLPRREEFGMRKMMMTSGKRARPSPTIAHAIFPTLFMVISNTCERSCSGLNKSNNPKSISVQTEASRHKN